MKYFNDFETDLNKSFLLISAIFYGIYYFSV